MTITYKTKGTCSSKMTAEVEEGVYCIPQACKKKQTAVHITLR